MDDDAQLPKLVLLHYNAARIKGADAAAPPDLVLKIFVAILPASRYTLNSTRNNVPL